MKIYTKTGDRGETGLYGADRVSKDHVRVEAYGTVDEANSALGVARSFLGPELQVLLENIQNALFDLGADLATRQGGVYEKHISRIDSEDVERLEAWIDEYQAACTPLTQFIHPGGSAGAAQLQLTRAIVRRAERAVVQLAGREEVNLEVLRYLNRLSDLLFVLARWVNQQAGIPESLWAVKKRK